MDNVSSFIDDKNRFYLQLNVNEYVNVIEYIEAHKIDFISKLKICFILNKILNPISDKYEKI